MVQRRALGQRQETLGVRARDEATAGPPVVPLGQRVGLEGLLRPQDRLEPRVRQVLARRPVGLLEDPDHAVVIDPIERQQGGDRRIPPQRISGDQGVAIELEMERLVEHPLEALGVLPAEPRLVVPQGVDPQHEQLPADGRAQQRLGQLAQARGHLRLAPLEQDLQPHHEAPAVEDHLGSGRILAPQLPIEHALDLRGRGHREQLTGIFEPHRAHQGGKARDVQRTQGLDVPRLVQEASKQAGRGRGHGDSDSRRNRRIRRTARRPSGVPGWRSNAWGAPGRSCRSSG